MACLYYACAQYKNNLCTCDAYCITQIFFLIILWICFLLYIMNSFLYELLFHFIFPISSILVTLQAQSRDSKLKNLGLSLGKQESSSCPELPNWIELFTKICFFCSNSQFLILNEVTISKISRNYIYWTIFPWQMIVLNSRMTMKWCIISFNLEISLYKNFLQTIPLNEVKLKFRSSDNELWQNWNYHSPGTSLDPYIPFLFLVSYFS